MKTNQEILDKFGELIINNIFDRRYKGLREIIDNGYKNPKMSHYNKLFSKLTQKERKKLNQFMIDNMNSLLFDFLNFFEENEEFKLIYEENGDQINLVKISEMLKAELIIEGGWIDRFSQYADEREK